MKTPMPMAGPINAANNIIRKGFAAITLYPALKHRNELTIATSRPSPFGRSRPSLVLPP